MLRTEILNNLFASAMRAAKTSNSFSVSSGGYKLTLELVKKK